MVNWDKTHLHLPFHARSNVLRSGMIVSLLCFVGSFSSSKIVTSRRVSVKIGVLKNESTDFFVKRPQSNRLQQHSAVCPLPARPLCHLRHLCASRRRQFRVCNVLRHLLSLASGWGRGTGSPEPSLEQIFPSHPNQPLCPADCREGVISWSYWIPLVSLFHSTHELQTAAHLVMCSLR